MKGLILALAMHLAIISFGQLNTQLYNAYESYAEKSITTRRFNHEDIMLLIDRLGNDFRVQQVGTSVEGRAIKMITVGNGPIQVLMWSQMHGDETTATRAILDVFHWLQADDQFNKERALIKSKITWHLVPMLNPDGASRFTRRNHHGIDINRDAIYLQTPEGRTLKKVRDSLKADWGFNLHDQGRGTSVEGKKPATISLLAPAFDVAKTVNEKRGDAMQLAKLMFDQITQYVPGQVGIYDDTFEPRAFGDNIQKWGTRTILIESGGYEDDYEKQYIRKLNFVLLITAAHAIASGAYEKTPVADYQKIPLNGSTRIRELIIKNVHYEELMRDIAFDRNERDSEDHRHYYAQGYVTDLGDLSTSNAYFTLDATDYEVLPGKVYDQELETMEQFNAVDIEALMKRGYTDFVVKQGYDPYQNKAKVNIHAKAPAPNAEIRMGGNPSLVFRKDNIAVYVLINGVLHALK